VSTLVNQVRALAHDFVRRGSKANRRLQVGRIIKFVEFIEETERPHNLHEIGHRHVVNFWKHHREFAPKTANDYWLAFCILWRWSGKTGTPPKPRFFSKQETLKSSDADANQAFDIGQVQVNAMPSLLQISSILKKNRLSHAMTIEAVSYATGVDSAAIRSLEDGSQFSRYVDIQVLANFYSNI
jgi:hypothetical protein